MLTFIVGFQHTLIIWLNEHRRIRCSFYGRTETCVSTSTLNSITFLQCQDHLDIFKLDLSRWSEIWWDKKKTYRNESTRMLSWRFIWSLWKLSWINASRKKVVVFFYRHYTLTFSAANTSTRFNILSVVGWLFGVIHDEANKSAWDGFSEFKFIKIFLYIHILPIRFYR